MIIYYCITIGLNIIAVFTFFKHINITSISIVPLFLIALMIFQAHIFKTDEGNSFGSDLTKSESNSMFKFGAKSLYATIPFMIPFSLFFHSYIKLFSIIIYIMGLIGGILIYRIKNKKSILTRINAEHSEKKNTENAEALGKCK